MIGMKVWTVMLVVWIAHAQSIAIGTDTMTDPNASKQIDEEEKSGGSSMVDPVTTMDTITATTDDPRKHCTVVKGVVPLRSTEVAPCDLFRLNDQAFRYTSPGFPQNYPDNIRCTARISSSAPRLLEVTPIFFKVDRSDRVVLKGPFGYKRRIRDTDLNSTITLPSAYARFIFESNETTNMKGFKLRVAAEKNYCQRVCNLLDGDTGILRKGPYEANSFCEWWMEAPVGCFIRMRFEKFDVGPASSGDAWSCDGDYVGVDRDGDPYYDQPGSKMFCGSGIPSGFRSVENKINVLFNGREGGYNGFELRYTVVC